MGCGPPQKARGPAGMGREGGKLREVRGRELCGGAEFRDAEADELAGGAVERGGGTEGDGPGAVAVARDGQAIDTAT